LTGSPVLPVRRFPALVVATPRLHIRALEIADAPDIDRMMADRLTQRWLRLPAEDWLPDGLTWCTELAARHRYTGDGDHYGVVRREDGRLVGLLWTWHTDWTARTTEVSIVVTPSARGYGVAAEAVDALAIALLLEHGFQRIELRVPPGNTGARRVAEKAGLVYEGLQRSAGYVHGGRVDLEMWSLVTGDLRPDPS
jgi:[ribosomal protein S5]-alanine N-acetyltransferase